MVAINHQSYKFVATRFDLLIGTVMSGFARARKSITVTCKVACEKMRDRME